MAKWEKGQSGNPTGRPVTDKTIAMKVIMQVFMKHKDKFEAELDKEAAKNIMSFYKTYVSPIQPKDFNIDGDLDIGLKKRLFDK
jgi:hypothetical protein